MNSYPKKEIISSLNTYLLFTILFFGGMYFAKSFLVPISIAVLLALMMLPLQRKLQEKHFSNTWSSVISVLIIFLFFAAIFFVLSLQISSIANDWDQIKKQLGQQLEQVQSFLQSQGITNQQIKKGLERISKSQGSQVQSAFGSVFGSLGNFLLVLIYTYLLLFYRHKFRVFFQKLTPEKYSKETDQILNSYSNIAKDYLSGRLLLILILAILYAIGFSVIGVKFSLLIACLAAILSIIPYIGNIIGGGLAIILAIATKGSIDAAIGVLAVMSVVQFIESYLLEPLVVGKKVEINPFFTILIIVLGGAVWGIAGMIIAIPYFGILKVTLDHVESFEPVAYLIGEEDNGDDDYMSKVKQWFKKKM